MSDRTLQQLTQRLDRLERENRWWRRLAIIGFLWMVAIISMGQAAPKPRVVETEKIVIKDNLGNVRAVIGQAQYGYGLLLFGSDGKEKARFVTGQAGSVLNRQADLSLGDDKGSVNLWTDIDSEGTRAHLQLHSVLGSDDGTVELSAIGVPLIGVRTRGGARAELSAALDGNPFLRFLDDHGQYRARLGLVAGDDVVLDFYKGEHVMWLGPLAGSPPSLAFTRDGKVIWKAQ